MQMHPIVRLAIVVTLVALASCHAAPPSISHVPIIARDYAFQFPRVLPAGNTAFRLVNHGTVVHEVQLYRFRSGISRDSAFRLLTTNHVSDSVIYSDGGVLIASPSDSTVQELLAPLHRGDVYALECDFRDAPGKPQHRDLGMVAVFEVQ